MNWEQASSREEKPWSSKKNSGIWIVQRDEKVFVSIVPSCSREELMPVIRGKILERLVFHPPLVFPTDCFPFF
jgi:hypothetical protein